VTNVISVINVINPEFGLDRQLGPVVKGRLARVSPAVAVAAAAAVSTTTAITTAATTTAVAAAVSAAATVATAATTAFAGGGFVDADHATHPLDILEVVDGFLLSRIIGKLNKGKTALATCFPIKGQAALAHLSVLAEEIKQVLAFCLEREVADVDGH
jgi:hypothetical protein